MAGQAFTKADEHQRDNGRSAEDQELTREVDEKLRRTEQVGYEKGIRSGTRRRTTWTLAVLMVILGSAGYFITQDPYARNAFRANAWFILLSAALGAAVGASELISRYRDEPMQAIRSTSAITYIALNALVSGCVYGLLTHYAKTLIPSLAKDPLMRSITAGFGAMAILRSKFFTIKTEKGDDVDIGPDAAVSAFLSAADRGVDRARAKRRLDLVFTSADRIPKLDNIKDFIKVALLSFQNLENREKLFSEIEAIYSNNTDYPKPELKLQATCYSVLVVLGEYNFNKLIINLATLAERQDRKDSAAEELVTLVQSRSSDQSAQPPNPPAAPAAKGRAPKPDPPANGRLARAARAQAEQR